MDISPRLIWIDHQAIYQEAGRSELIIKTTEQMGSVCLVEFT